MKVTTGGRYGSVKLNGRLVGHLKRCPIKREGWEANVDRLTRPHQPIHDRPSVCEQWNYPHKAFFDREEALAWIQKHADEIAEAFPLRFGLEDTQRQHQTKDTES